MIGFLYKWASISLCMGTMFPCISWGIPSLRLRLESKCINRLLSCYLAPFWFLLVLFLLNSPKLFSIIYKLTLNLQCLVLLQLGYSIIIIKGRILTEWWSLELNRWAPFHLLFIDTSLQGDLTVSSLSLEVGV